MAIRDNMPFRIIIRYRRPILAQILALGLLIVMPVLGLVVMGADSLGSASPSAPLSRHRAASATVKSLPLAGPPSSGAELRNGSWESSMHTATNMGTAAVITHPRESRRPKVRNESVYESRGQTGF